MTSTRIGAVGLALTAVVVLGAVVIGRGGKADVGQRNSSPTVAASATQTPTVARPQTAHGLPVMSVGDVLEARAAGSLGSQQVAVGGYWSAYIGPTSCGVVDPALDMTLELACRDGEYGITELAEPILVVGPSGSVATATGPHLTPWVPPDVSAHFPRLPRFQDYTLPVPIVVVGHFADPRAAECRPAARELCLNRLVLDEIAWIDVESAVSARPTPTQTPFPSPAPPGLFGPESCQGDVPYSFFGWTTPKELLGVALGPSYVWAAVTRDVVLLTTDGWEDDPNGSGHRYQTWGRRICLAYPEDPGGVTFFAVPGSAYVLWDDGLRTVGESPARPTPS